jgi:hypothetical protein
MSSNHNLRGTFVDSSAIEEVERALLNHPDFGDSSRIEKRVLTRYRFGLELAADHLPSLRDVAALVDSLPEAGARRLFLDPAVRLAMENAIGRLESGSLRAPDPLEDLLPAAVAEHARDPSRTYTESRVCQTGSTRVGPARTAWVGQLDRAQDPRLQSLRANLAAALPTTSTYLAPTPAILEQVDRACSLLSDIFPSLGPAVLGHVAAIGVIETRAEEGNLLSASGGDVAPSTMVVSPRQLVNPWDAAGHLLHEGLHLKLFDVARVHSLLREPDVLVGIPWRKVPFTLSRVVFSFHVYVHMLLFKATVDEVGAKYFDVYGEPHSISVRAQPMSVVRSNETAEYGRAIDRTRFLHEHMVGPWSPYLSRDGAALIDWLTSCVERIAPDVRSPSRGRER